MREYKEKLKLNLDEKRYNHSIAVADAAKDLAKRFGEDESRAYVAGLLHDCAKYKDIENQLKKCKDYNVEISEFEMSVLPIIHAPLGSYK